MKIQIVVMVFFSAFNAVGMDAPPGKEQANEALFSALQKEVLLGVRYHYTGRSFFDHAVKDYETSGFFDERGQYFTLTTKSYDVRGDVEAVLEELKKGADVDARDQRGRVPLRQTDRKELIRVLLWYGADTKDLEETVSMSVSSLECKVFLGMVDEVKQIIFPNVLSRWSSYLLGSGISRTDLENVFLLAVGQGLTSIVRLLLDGEVFFGQSIQILATIICRLERDNAPAEKITPYYIIREYLYAKLIALKQDNVSYLSFLPDQIFTRILGGRKVITPNVNQHEVVIPMMALYQDNPLLLQIVKGEGLNVNDLARCASGEQILEALLCAVGKGNVRTVEMLLHWLIESGGRAAIQRPLKLVQDHQKRIGASHGRRNDYQRIEELLQETLKNPPNA